MPGVGSRAVCFILFSACFVSLPHRCFDMFIFWHGRVGPASPQCTASQNNGVCMFVCVPELCLLLHAVWSHVAFALVGSQDTVCASRQSLRCVVCGGWVLRLHWLSTLESDNGFSRSLRRSLLLSPGVCDGQACHLPTSEG